jgi:hypothetical protein
MRSLARILAVLGVVSLVVTGCDSPDGVNPAAPAPVVVAPAVETGSVTAQFDNPPLPPPVLTCTSKVSGAYTCTTCTYPNGYAVDITCVPTPKKKT